MVFSVPILKHQTFFLQESTQYERIQLVPIDLGILGHIVPIYRTASVTGRVLFPVYHAEAAEAEAASVPWLVAICYE